MSRLRSWLHDRLQKTYSQSLGKKPTLIDPAKAIVNSPFYRLPYEIREIILHLAFGNRVVHLDLLPPRSDDPWDKPFIEDLEPQQLRWWGSICSRGEEEDACKDWCRVKLISPEPRTEENCLGIMGWLLSCRMGYREGVAVLYKSNTIHIGSAPLIRNIDVVLPSGHLEMINSLELIGDFDIFRDYSGEGMMATSARDWAMFDEIVTRIPVLFPALRYLYLSIEHGENHNYQAPSEDMMRKLERTLSRVESTIGMRGTEMTTVIAIPESLYDVAEKQAAEKGFSSGGPFGFPRESCMGSYWVRCGEDDSFIVCRYALFD